MVKGANVVKDRSLNAMLGDVKALLVKGKPNTDPDVRKLHGAGAELAKAEGLLSVTSMNQLVHNAVFPAIASEICALFARVFPLLEAMNA